MPTPVMVRRVLVLLAMLFGIAGCDDPTGPGAFEFLVQVRAVRQPVTLAAQGGSSPSPTPGVLDAVEIDEAVVVFGGLTLEGSANANTTDWNHDKTVVLPLRLSGDPTLAFSPTTDGGEYKGLRVHLDRLDPSDPNEAGLADVFPRLEGLSVLVGGTTLQDGTSEDFVFTTSVSGEARLQFPEPRRFTSEGAAVALYTVAFNLDQWFETADGLLLDPNDEADRAAIEESILRSMKVLVGSGG